MTLATSDISFSIAEGSKVAELTADSSSALTYDTAIDISIVSATFSKEFFQAELRADGKIKDKYSEFEKITGSFTLAEIDLDTLAVLTGGAVVNSGTGSGEKQTYYHDTSNNPNYFAFGFKSLYSPVGTVGDKHYILRKCKITGIDMGGGDREYSNPVINFEAIRTINSHATFKDTPLKIVFNKTATDISFS